MYGWIFVSIETYLKSKRNDIGVVAAAKRAVALKNEQCGGHIEIPKEWIIHENYPDYLAVELIVTSASILNLSTDVFLEEFGSFFLYYGR
jgi:hypothetical protein